MSTCWAACLGNCSNKTSREHLITEGLFLDDKIKVKGFSWCLDEFKIIGLASLVRKALCTVHNSSLSDVDDVAISLMKTLRDAIELINIRRLLMPQVWEIESSNVDGSKLERWFLKTLITAAFGEKFLIGKASLRPGEPSPALVEIAFGLKRFKPPAGLYFIGDEGEKWSEEGITMTTFGDRKDCHAGARFWYRGLDCMLLLDGEDSVSSFSFTTIDGKETKQATTRYRPHAVRMSVGDRLSQIVRFTWDE